MQDYLQEHKQDFFRNNMSLKYSIDKEKLDLPAKSHLYDITGPTSTKSATKNGRGSTKQATRKGLGVVYTS